MPAPPLPPPPPRTASGRDTLIGGLIGVGVLGPGAFGAFVSDLWFTGASGRWATIALFAVPPLAIAGATLVVIALRRPWLAAGMAVASALWVVTTVVLFVRMLSRFGLDLE